MDNEKKATIMVVEDERSLAGAVKIKLEAKGFIALVARSVEEAEDTLRSNKDIKALWLDHYLLGAEDGLDLVARLKEEKSPWKSLPIFVVSNTASNEKVRSYLSLGVDKYYTKSDFSLEEIIGELTKAIKK
jgi:DNA-binding response OmpR family regulator